MANLSLHKPVKREKQWMKINLKNEGNLCAIKEDFLPKEFNDFFAKWQ